MPRRYRRENHEQEEPRDAPRRTGGALKDRVLEALHDAGKPMAVREIVRRLGMGADERHELKGVLRQMIAAGDVVKIHGARVGLPDRMNLVVGRLHCSPSGYGFVLAEKAAGAPRGRGGDVYVSAVNMKEALHGDRVVARVERHTPKGPEGRVIRILDRAQQHIVGRYEDDGRSGGRVVPFDKRILHEVFVPKGDAGAAQSGEMVLAEITRPPSATRNPIGAVLQVLGRLEDPGVDLKVILAKYALAPHFPPEVEAEATSVPAIVRPEDTRGRTDFRGEDIVTIDPETARDHDDAVVVDRLPHGHWRLGVHIADVAHYVRPGRPLDQEAYLRGTSVYFPETVVPMLPHALSSNICSLVEGQDRLVQSVVLELDARGKVRKTEFHDGVIRSRAKMSYQQAQRIVDGDVATRERFAPLVDRILAAQELAGLMRKRRFERGSLDFDLPEPKLVLDDSGRMLGIQAAERLDSMRMIEEFMLAANEAVAEALDKAGMPTLFRVHEQPDPQKVEEFTELVSSFGYRVPTTLDEIAPQDFQRVLRQIEGKPEEKLISYLLLRTMRLARYHEENLGHFGLATSMYAHFTSPIRRYPDLVVHRSLRALRHRRKEEALAQLPAGLPEMGLHLSEMERRASDAERELVEWKKIRFMADKVGEAYSGYVTGVQAFGLFVELEEIYIQGLVHVSSMSDDYYQFNERAHQLKGENTGKVYRLGDRVEVQVVKVDQEQRKVDFALVDVLERAAARRVDGAAPRRPRVVEGGRSRGPAARPDRPRHERRRPERGRARPRRRR
jgi:ribonuclease R